jgi:antitoxin (DNA-binding transcriptional repressor) of toxin-antitoxin stability system
MIVDVATAENDLDRLIDLARAGEDVIIAVDARPAVKLAPIRNPVGKRVFGSMKGKFTVTREFFEPLPEDELSSWGQG